MCAAILIVEDEQCIADLLQDRLSDEGFRVTVACTGADAMKALRSGGHDVVTLDIYLPDSNGLTILNDLKSNPETERIPVVIISSSDEGEGARSLGAEDFVRKPIDFPRLLGILNGIATRVQKP